VGRSRIYSCVAGAAFVLLCGCANRSDRSPVEPLNYLPGIAGDYFPINSAVTGSAYHIYIRYPESYAAKPDMRYPIVYVLDGDTLFPMLAPEHLFLTYDDHLPEAIIVGIAYGSFAPPINRREIDFGEGAANFQRFLATELLPEVEQRVRADADRRILVGQSFGGDFVLYSAFAQPDLFWARIASNPSFRLHRELGSSAPAPANKSDLHLFLVSGTANNPRDREAALNWLDSWRGRVAPWKLERIDIQGGTHAADIANAYRASLRKLFPVTDR
jgi:predicted alpha/beta superfamily hydrolase